VDPDELLLGMLADGGDHATDEFRDEPTVRGKFVRDVAEAPLSADDREHIRRIGLSALQGRSDLWPAADGWE
jgi:hypothetical protein